VGVGFLNYAVIKKITYNSWLLKVTIHPLQNCQLIFLGSK
jgi:hypothetical protein